MPKVKICPACGHKNPYTNLCCENCPTNIAGIDPVEDEPTEHNSNFDKTIVEMKNYVILNFNNNQIKVYDGEIIGRHAKGGEIFQNIMEVSRKHAKFSFEDSHVYITDLNSTNGVFLNGRKIQPGVPEKITEGTEIRLCSKVTLRVEKIFSGNLGLNSQDDAEENYSISNSIDGTKICKNCGKEIDFNEKVCPYCLEEAE